MQTNKLQKQYAHNYREMDQQVVARLDASLGEAGSQRADTVVKLAALVRS